MARSDFYVTFGSNADDFAKQLPGKFAPAQKFIQSFAETLFKLDVAVAERSASMQQHLVALARQAEETAKQLNVGGDDRGQGGVGAAASASQVIRDMHSISAELDGIVGKIKEALVQMTRLPKTAGDFVKAEEKHYNQSRAALERKDVVRDPATGRIVSPGSAGAVPFRGGAPSGLSATDRAILQRLEAQNRGQTPIGTQPATPSTISNLPKAVVDEASFTRLVAVAQQNVDATHSVVRAIDRLNARLNTGGGGGPAPPAPPTGGRGASPKPPGPAAPPVAGDTVDIDEKALEQLLRASQPGASNKEIRKQLAALKAQANQASAEVVQTGVEVIKITDDMSKKQKSAARRANAAAERAALPQGLDRAEYDRRLLARERLDLPANPELFRSSVGRGRGQINRDELVAIAKTFTEQGYPTRASSRVAVPQLVENILASRLALEAAGGHTAQDLRVGVRPKADDQISPNIHELVGRLGDLNEVVTRANQLALPVKQLNTLTGAPRPQQSLAITDPLHTTLGFPTSSVLQIPGRAKGGATPQGGAFGGSRSGAVEDADRLLDAARQARKEVALARAREIAQLPLEEQKRLDPFDPAVGKGIEGTGDTARRFRENLAALRSAFKELDKLGAEAQQAADRLHELQGFEGRVHERAALVSEIQGRGEVPNRGLLEKVASDAARLPAVQDEIHRLHAYLEQRREFLTPEFQAGYHHRQAAIPGFDAYREQVGLEAEQRRTARADQAEGLGAALTGGRLAAGYKDTLTRLVPGVAFNRAKGTYHSIDPEADPTPFQEMTRAAKSWHAAGAKLQRLTSATERDEEAIAKQTAKLQNKAQALLNSIETAAGPGFSPTYQQLTGHEPPADIAVAEGERTERRRQALGLASVQPARPGDKGIDPGVAAKTRELLTARQVKVEAQILAAKEAVKAATEVELSNEKTLAAALDKQGRAALRAADDQIVAAEKAYQRSQIAYTRGASGYQTRDPRQLAAAKFGDERGPSGRLRDPYRRDALGYDVELGYAPSAATTQAQRQARSLHQREDAIRAAQAARQTIVDPILGANVETGTKRAIRETAKALAIAERSLKSVNEALESLDSIKVREPKQLSKKAQRKADEAAALQAAHEDQIDSIAGTEPRKRRARKSAADTEVAAVEQISDERRKAAIREREAIKKQLAAAQATLDPLVAATRSARAGYAGAASSLSRQQKLGAEPAALATKEALVVERKAAYDAAKATEDEARAAKEVLRERKKILDALIRANKGGGSAGGGGAGTGGGEGTGAVGGGGGGGRDNSILARILTHVQSIDRQLAAGVKSRKSPESKAPAAVVESGSTRGPDGRFLPRASQPATATTPARIVPNAAGLEAFAAQIEKVDPALAHLIRTEKTAETATGLVERGLLTATDALKLYAGALGLSSGASKKFAIDMQTQLAAQKGATAAERIVQDKRVADPAAAEVQARKVDAKINAKTAENLRNEARAAVRLAEAEKILTTATKGEIEALHQLNLAGADQIKIAQQQARVYASVAADFHRAGLSQVDARQVTRSVLNTAGPKVSGTEFEDIGRTARSINGFKQLDSAMASGVPDGGFFGANSAFTKKVFGNTGFWSRILASTGTFLVRNFSAGFVFGLTNALQDVAKQALLTESTFIRVSEALQATGRSTGDLRTQLQDVSNTFGTSLNDVYEVAAGLTGLFDSTDEIAGATKVVSQLELISMGALNAQEAMKSLASLASAFGNELEAGVPGLQHIADVLTVIQDNLSVNIEVSAEGAARLAGLAAQLKIPFEAVAVYTAQIAKQTGQDGAAAGEQFSRILAALQTGRGQSAVNKAFAGTALPQQLAQGDYGAALETLQRNWDGLTDAQKRNVSVALGGQRQAAATAALFADGAKTLDVIRRAQYAKGQADERASNLLQQLNPQLRVFRTNLQAIAQFFVRSGLLDFLGLVLVSTNQLLKAFNHMLSMFNDIADSNPFTKLLREVGFGLLGLVAIVAIAQKTFRGLKAAALESTAVQNIRSAVAGEGVVAAEGAVASRAFSRTSLRGVPEVRSASFQQRPVTTLLGAPTTAVGRGLSAVGRGLDSMGAKLALSQERIVAETAARTLSEASLKSSAVEGAALRQSVLRGRLGAVAGGLGRGSVWTGDALAAVGRGQGGAFFESATRRLQAVPRAIDIYGVRNAEGELTRGSRLLQTSARAGARATAGLASGFDKFAASGLGAQVAIGAVVAGFSLWISTMRDAAELHKQVDLAYDAYFGKNQGKTPDQVAREAYIGPDTEIVNQLNEKYNSPGFYGTLKSGASALKAAVFGGQSFSEQTGDYGSRELEQYLIPLFQKQLNDAVGSGEIGILAARKSVAAKLTAKADEVKANPLLSDAQKANYLSNLERVTTFVNDTTQSLLLQADGLKNAALLTSDQTTQIDSLAGTLSTIGQSTGGQEVLTQYSDVFTSLIDDIGLRPDNPAFQALTKLAEGNAGPVAQLQALRKSYKSQIQGAKAKLLASTDESGVTTLEAADLKETQDALSRGLANLAANTDAIIQAVASNAQMIAEQAANAGNYDKSRAVLDQAAARIRAKFPDIEALRRQRQADLDKLLAFSGNTTTGFGRYVAPSISPAQRAKQRSLLAPVLQQRTQLDITAATEQSQLAAASTTDPLVQARANLQTAQKTLSILRQRRRIAGPEAATTAQIQQAKIQAIQAEQGVAAAMLTLSQARVAFQVAGMYDQSAINARQETAALEAFRNAKGRYQKFVTGAAYRQAAKASQDTASAEAAAARETTLAGISPGNAIATANQALANARAAQADATKFGTASVEYQSAVQATLAAERQVQDAVAAVGQARTGLLVAIATAAGNTVKAAVLGAQQAQQALQQALVQSGGAESADVLSARAQVVSANAAIRDAKLQDQLDTIDFQMEMDRLTAAGAIKLLRNLLKADDLTKQQRRSLLLKIKGLQDDIGGDSQFNIGENIKLPTPYEVRRSLGIDKLRREARNIQATMKEAVSGFGGGASSQVASQSDPVLTAAVAQLAGAVKQIGSVRDVTVSVNGADIAKVRQILEELLGTQAPRRSSTSYRKVG